MKQSILLRLFWLLLALVTVWVFRSVAQMGYVLWDDNAMIQDNALLRLPFGAAMQAMFSGFYLGDYMPLTLASYWFELRLFGFTGAQQHLLNLSLHLLNTALLAAWMMQIPGVRRWIPLICAVFALHPAQVESVAWISERKGLLASGLYFIAIWTALRASRASSGVWLYRTCYLVFFIAAALAKANGLLLPLWLCLLGWVEFGRKKSRCSLLATHLPVIVAAALFAWIRTKAYASSIPTLGAAAFDWVHLGQLPGSVLAALGFYAHTLLYPDALSIIYPPYSPDGAWANATVAGGLLLGLAICGAVAKPWRRAALWLLFAGVTIAPVLQIVPRLNFVNDRYLYLPIIGFTAWLALSIEALLRRLLPSERVPPSFGTALPLVLAVLFIPLGALASSRRLPVWSSNMALWTDTVAKRPDSSLAHNNLGQALLDQGDRLGAIKAFAGSIVAGQAHPSGDNSALNNLAMIHSDQSHPETFDLNKAAALFQQGVEMAPRPEEAFILRFNLALVHLQARQVEQAVADLQMLNKDLNASANQHYLFLQERVRGMLQQLGQVVP